MRPRLFILADRVAPVLAVGVLVAIIAAGNLDTLRHPGAPAYFLRVAAAIDRIPFKVGDYVGDDQEITPAAVQLLKPNRLLQRAFLDPRTGRAATLLFVHCEDSRDMIGHYPPVCYPAHGWRMESATDVTISMAGETFPARRYEFSQRGLRMHVLNFFILPSSGIGIVPDRQAAAARSASRRLIGLGAGQVQVVTSDRTLLDDPEGIVGQIIETIEPAVREISRGPTSE